MQFHMTFGYILILSALADYETSFQAYINVGLYSTPHTQINKYG